VALQVRSWREGFANILGDELISSAQARIELASAGLEARLRDLGARRLVADLEGRPAGFSTYGPSRDEDADEDAGELMALFVDPSAWGRGVASALVDGVLAELCTDGFREATLWSFDANQTANRVYERRGFARDGTEDRREPFGNVLLVRMRRALRGG